MSLASLTIAFWRKWHRWIGFPTAIFLIWAAATGFLVAFTEFFGEEEAKREATRDLVSPVTLASAPAQWSDPLARALQSARASAADAPLDKAVIEFKGERPTVTLFTGKAAGGEDRKLVFDATTSALISSESYADKPLLYRLHSGEAFGDGGLLVAMFWAISLLALTITGLIIYLKMRRPGQTGVRRFFW
jgi:uncharacterized iron-regulated membrane protein